MPFSTRWRRANGFVRDSRFVATRSLPVDGSSSGLSGTHTVSPTPPAIGILSNDSLGQAEPITKRFGLDTDEILGDRHSALS